MNPTDTSLERFTVAQQKLVGILNRVHPCFTELGATSVRDLIETLSHRVRSERLKVLIVGEFNRGKSTVINALLAAEVLPAYAVPCTAVMNVIKYGDTKRAVVHFHNPLPEKLPQGLSSRARAHIERHGQPVPPMEVDIATDVKELEAYLAIPDPAKDHADSVAETPFRLVEVFWPLDVLRNGFELIDSPGLNEHRTRTTITVDYVDRSDAIVHVLSSPLLCAGTEMDFIENNLRAAGHIDIFFVCNMFDQVRERERDRVTSFGRERLEPLTRFGHDGVFFVSALDALEGRVFNQPEVLARSNFLPFERRLLDFVVLSRGRFKLLQPSRQLLGEVNKALNQTLPAQRKMLQESTAEIEKRLEEIRPQVENTRARCNQVLQRVHRERERLRMEVQDKMEMEVRSIAERIEGWISEYEPTERVKVFSLSTKAQAERLVKEVSEYAEGKIAADIGSWRRETLIPFVQDRLADLGSDIEPAIKEILDSVDAMKSTLTHGEVPTGSDADGFERAAAFFVGLAIGGAGAAGLGLRYGFKEMLKGIVPGVAVAIGAMILGVLNPMVLLGLMLGASTLQGMSKAAKLTEELKTEASKSITKQLKKQAATIAKDAACMVYTKTAEIQDQIEAGLKREVQSVTDLADSVLEDKRRGEANVQARLHTLGVIGDELVEAQSALGDLECDLEQ